MYSVDRIFKHWIRVLYNDCFGSIMVQAGAKKRLPRLSTGP